MKWIRVSDITPYIEAGDLPVPEEDYSLCKRVYSQPYKTFPLMYISIHGNSNSVVHKLPITGISISSAYKEKSGDWWETMTDQSYIPLELVGEVQEMIVEAMDKIKVQNEIRT